MPNLQIPLPPPPSWALLQPQDSESPYAPFYTPPETLTPSPSIFYTPPQSPATLHPPHLVLPPNPHPPPTEPTTDDPFPAHVDHAVDLPFDDDNLSTLEKIYLYSRSKAPYHRVFIAHALPQYLHSVSPQDAVAYVLPLLSGLAMDDDEQVKEAFAAELVPVVWWFFSHCQVIPDELNAEETHASSSTTVTVSVQAFTPILGTLLLSPNPLVGGAARFAVVDLLSRMKRADDRERDLHGAFREQLDLPASAPVLPAAAVAAAMKASSTPLPLAPTHEHHTHHTTQTSTHTPREHLHPWEIVPDDDDDVEDKVPLILGMFGFTERALFTQEILQQVVIGMGRLDDVDYEEELMDEGDEDQQAQDYQGQEGARMAADQDVSPRPLGPVTPDNQPQPVQGSSNPYFPSVASQQTSIAAQEAAQHAKYSAMPWYSPPVAPAAVSPPAAQSPSGSSTGGFSPGVEYPSSPSSIQSSRSSGSSYLERFSSSGPNESIFQPPESARSLGNVPSAMEVAYNWEGMDYDEGGEDEQAAVGRLSSMSLMAAVTASGTLDLDMQRAFVEEVQRVGGDPVYWVRREASFALGALAKVVPEELVISTLLPLFDKLRRDPVWHVRHSVLFALPAVLERLAPDHRKRVALETITGLARDQSPAVRSGVLEALGEVIHTFHGDPEGPPSDLLALFLGIRDSGSKQSSISDSTGVDASKPTLPSRNSDASVQSQHSVGSLTSEVLYDDPKRNLICAFNFPAVALTLGTEGWQSLRDSYFAIAADTSTGVRRTLAASLGELARIVGPESTRQDLVKVWHVYVRAEEEEVRSKAIETLSLLMTIAGGREVGRECLHALVRCWEEGILRGWREREMVVRGLVRWLRLVGVGYPGDLEDPEKAQSEAEKEEQDSQREMATVAKRLLMKGLEDSVAAVRESSVLVTPDVWQLFADHVPGLTDELDRDLQQLATSTNYRRRMTFVGCRQALALALDENDRPLVFPCVVGSEKSEAEKVEGKRKDDLFLRDIHALSFDSILGVRIGVARFAGTVHDNLILYSLPIPMALRNLVDKLMKDASSEVRAYVAKAAKSGGGVEQPHSLRSAIAAIPLAGPILPVGGSMAAAATATAIPGEGSGDSFPSNTSTASSMSVSSASSSASVPGRLSRKQAKRATFSRPPPALIVSPSPRSAPGSGATSRSSSSQTGYFDLVVPKRPSSALSNHSVGSGPSGSSGGAGAGGSVGGNGGGSGGSGGHGTSPNVSANWASLGLGQPVASPLMYSPGLTGYSGTAFWGNMGSIAAKKGDAGTPTQESGSGSGSRLSSLRNTAATAPAPSPNKPPSHPDVPMDG